MRTVALLRRASATCSRLGRRCTMPMTMCANAARCATPGKRLHREPQHISGPYAFEVQTFGLCLENLDFLEGKIEHEPSRLCTTGQHVVA